MATVAFALSNEDRELLLRGLELLDEKLERNGRKRAIKKQEEILILMDKIRNAMFSPAWEWPR